MAITLAKIAKRAGCSYGTVSNILSRNDPRYSRRTRERVCRIARELGYVAHRPAQTLTTGRAHCVGIVGVDWADPHLLKAVVAAGSIVSINNQSLAIDVATDYRQAATLLLQRKVDLVISVSYLRGPVEMSDESARVRDRIIMFNGVPEPFEHSRYTVFWDEREGGALAAEHLLDLGHREMAVLSADAVSARIGGFLARCGSVGIQPIVVVTRPATEWARRAFDMHGRGYDRIVFSDRSEGSHQLQVALAENPEVTGVFARNDRVAGLALEGARQSGLAVPGRLSIVGYGNDAETAPCFGRITSVHTPIAEGIRIVLEDYFDTLRKGTEPRRDDLLLQVTLAPGATTGRVKVD